MVFETTQVGGVCVLPQNSKQFQQGNFPVKQVSDVFRYNGKRWKQGLLPGAVQATWCCAGYVVLHKSKSGNQWLDKGVRRSSRGNLGLC